MDLSFKHPGDDKEVDLSSLWANQKVLPEPVLTRKVVDEGVKLTWDEHIFGGDKNVEFR